MFTPIELLIVVERFAWLSILSAETEIEIIGETKPSVMNATELMTSYRLIGEIDVLPFRKNRKTFC